MDKRILILRNLVLANLKSPLTLDDISAALNVSASRLRQLVKEETGMPFGEYVRHLRLEKSRELLETTLLRAQEIGVAVGIGDQSYFNRIFKEKYGTTPKKYQYEHCDLFASNEDADGAK